MKQLKHLCSLLLVFALTLGCVSGLCLTVSAEEDVSPYHLYVGSVAVTPSNANDVLGDGKVRFDPDTFTLYLNNANITDTHNCENYENIHPDYQYSACILYEYAGGRDLTIELTGTNSVGTKTVQYGICGNRKMILTGSGSLNVKGKTAIVTISGGLVLQSGKVIATGYEKNAVRGAAGGTIWVNGGELRAIVPTSVTASDTTGIAICTRSSFHVNGGTVYAAATQNAKAIFAESKIYVGQTHLAMNANQTAQLVLKDEKYFTIDGSTIAKTVYILPKVQYPITVNSINGTTVLDTYQTYKGGMVRFLELTPDPLCILESISVRDEYTGSEYPVDLSVTTVIPPDWYGYTFYMPDAPATVRVEFARYQHRVSFLPGYGSGTMEDVDLTFDENGEATYVLPSTTPFDPPETAPEGTVLGGWYVNNGTAVIPCGTEITLTDNTVLTAVWKETHDEADFFAWGETDSLPEQGNYFLLYDVTLTEPHVIQNLNVLRLCLNGRTVTQTGENACVIDVAGVLGLFDPSGEGAITGGTDSGIQVNNALVLYGGNITGNSSSGNGGGIRMKEEGSLFSMEGGSVSGNTASGNGGGVYAVSPGSWLTGAAFTGGTISGNTAGGSGGGVYLSVSSANSHFSDPPFQNVTITGNACGGTGGGIYISADTTASIDSGMITGNTAGTAAGGVYAGGTLKSAFTGVNALFLTDNTVNGTADNLYLPAGKKIIFDAETSAGANVVLSSLCVGVTTETLPAPGTPVVLTENAPESFYRGMHSDNEDYSVQEQNGEAILSDYLTVTLLPGRGSGDPFYAYVYEGGTYRLPNYNDEIFSPPADYGGSLAGWIVNGVMEIVPPDTEITVTEATTATAIWYERHDSNYFEPWIYTDHLPTEQGNWYLLNDVTLTETWEVPEQYYPTRLCLCGKTITRTGTGSAIHIASGNKLEILDHEGGSMTGSNRSAIVVESGAKLTIYGGTFTGNSAASGEKGGVIYNAGTTTIYSGAFTGNSVGGNGSGGVFANYGTFIIRNGVFTENTGGEAGVGFNAAGATLEIYDGTFSNNRNTYNGFGGGAFVNNGVMNVFGGTLTGNTALANGGAIWNGLGGSLSLSDDTLITENHANDGGGIFCRADYSSFSVYGSPRVFGNTEPGGAADNIYLKTGAKIHCSGNGSELLLAVTAEAPKPAVITDEIASNNQARPNYFLSDDPDYLPAWSDNREIMLTRAYVIQFDANGGSGTMEEIRTLQSSVALPACGFDAPVGMHFKCWSSGGVELSNSFTFTEGTYHYTLKPVWEANEYSVVIEGNSESGTVSAGGDTARYGETVTLTVSPAEGYVLDSLTVADAEGNPVSLSEDMTFVMPASDVTVTVAYRAVDYTITLNETLYGLAEADAETANCGQTVTITLTPDAGFEVESVTVLDAGENEIPVAGSIYGRPSSALTFVMPASDVTVTVTFREIVYYTVTVGTYENGTVTANKTSAGAGESVTLTVVPDENCTLRELICRWDDGETSDFTVDEDAHTYTFQMPAADVEILASFLRIIPYIDAAGNDMAPIVDYTIPSAETTVLNGGWYVAMDTVTIPERVTVSGTVNLILCDGAVLNVPKGITVDPGNALVIWQQRGDNVGQLNAGGSTSTNYAGIGGSEGSNGYYAGESSKNTGNITVNGGEITARGGSRAAGIGGGLYRKGGVITINAGTVKAYGGQRGAGIGGGDSAAGGIITINGGVVTAEGDTEYYGGLYKSGAGIGGGSGGDGGSITINGGTVSTRGGSYSASIGGGYDGGAGTVLIAGGKVTAADGGIGTSTWPYFTYSGTVTLRWTEETRDTMEVYAEGYRGDVTLEMPFCDKTSPAPIFAGVIEDLTQLEGKTLIPSGWPVVVECGAHGAVIAEPGTAFPGETVTLTVTPEPGYALETLTVTDASGSPVDLTGSTFTMPASAVTVTASFVRSIPEGYYLIGPDGWTVDDVDPNNVFTANPENANEFMLTVTLTEGDPIKVVHVTNGAIDAWYPEGTGNEYVVDAAHAGEKTVYFKTSYDQAWSAFGGYIWIDPNEEPSTELDLVINNTLALEGATTLNYFVNKNALDAYELDSFKLVVIHTAYVDGEYVDETVELTAKDELYGGSYYWFEYKNIAAKELNDRMVAHVEGLKDGVTFTSNEKDYNPISYCYVIAQRESSGMALRKTCADMIKYCAAAQICFSYNTANPADADWNEVIDAMASQGDPVLANYKEVIPLAGQTCEIKTYTLDVSGRVNINYYVLPDSGVDHETLTLVCTYRDVKGNDVTAEISGADWTFFNATYGYVATLNTVNAGEMREIITAVVKDANGNVISNTYKTSIETYAKTIVDRNNNPTLIALLKAMLNYGTSAQALLA